MIEHESSISNSIVSVKDTVINQIFCNGTEDTHKSFDSAFFAKNKSLNARIDDRSNTASVGSIVVKLSERVNPDTEVGSSGSSSTPIISSFAYDLFLGLNLRLSLP